MGNVSVVIVVAILYFLLMIAIGWYSQRQTSNTGDDYFLANRTVQGGFLFAAILGTNLSSFVMLGMPGAAYHQGYGMYSLILQPFFIAFCFYFGVRVWILGKKFGFTTPSELYGDRFQSPVVSLLMFIIFAVYTLPYITIGQIGAGAAFASFTNNTIPFWLGSLIVTIIVGFYVWGGGMRGTVLTNVAQVIIFMLFLLIAFIMIAVVTGGPSQITQMIQSQKPELLHRSASPAYSWQGWVSQWILFFLVLFSFPHVFVRFLSAKNANSLRTSAIYYPIGAIVPYALAVSLGVWGAVLIPGLQGTQSDNILFALTGQFLPVWIGGLALAGLFAMVMSTMDAQVLTMSQLFTQDIVNRYFKLKGDAAFYGRMFVAILLILSYLYALSQPGSVFQLANLSFTGTTAMVPVMLGAIFWRRLNKWGAIAGLLTAGVTVPIYFFTSWLPSFKFLPIVPCLVLTALVMIIVTYLTPPQYEAADKHLNVLKQYSPLKRHA